MQQDITKALGGFINFFFSRVLDPLIVLFVVIAFIIFFWFIVKQLVGKIEMGAKTPKSMGIYGGIIGLTIMLTAIAIVWFIANTGDRLFNTNASTQNLDDIKYIKINGR